MQYIGLTYSVRRRQDSIVSVTSSEKIVLDIDEIITREAAAQRTSRFIMQLRL